MADAIRVQKAVAGAGLMSRRAAEDAIREGRVAIDGRPAVLGDRVDVSAQQVTVDGIPIPVDPDLATYLLYKPPGVVSSASDPEGRRTVVDLVPGNGRLFPVGRLDYDSEGLILLTNDGDLANRVTHPRYGIVKKYMALVGGGPTKTDVRRLVQGIDLEDGPARALSASILGRQGDETMVELTMGEGRNREVRRMFESIGFQVIRLVRTAIGPISDRSLKPGESRRLSSAEIRDLLASGSSGDR
ncbi:MAG TPA: pseudouridine synthase [Acidimicrobiia bacterium]|nr:pseudouridine synthase [Acidimicrobiia bacterium]